MSRGGPEGVKIYIGDLPKDASEKELERAFASFGEVTSVWVARNPPGFAFVHIKDRLDADDAVRDLDGSMLCGVRIRVELSSGRQRSKNYDRGPPSRYGSGGGGGYGDRYGGRDSGRRSPPPTRYSRGSPKYDRYRKSASRSRSRSRDRTRRQRSYSRSRSRSRGKD